MTISSINKRALLVIIHSLLIVDCSFGQGAPVSQSANSMIDINTGDFQYSLPVMTVPGPNGEQVPIAFIYHGGIHMDEQASWIGLGWDYNPGEISHSVSGVSDDWKNKNLLKYIKRSGMTDVSIYTKYYGALYFKNLDYTDTTASMDVGTSTYKLTDGMFYQPDYDSYNVSGPGISGRMEPCLFDDGGYFHMKDQPGSYTYASSPHSTAFNSSKQANFVFTNELNGNIAPLSSATGGYYGTYNASANRAQTASYIEYFTNTDINTGVSGFLDYRTVTGTRRPTTDFDATDIGAFRITSSNGMIYHYSLPVYMLANEQSTTFTQDSTFGINTSQNLVQNKRQGAYVLSWKLTAVTGPDYVDANSNGIADIGDTGYWIAYNYGLWMGDFAWRTPFFGYKPNQYSKRVKASPPGARSSLYSVQYSNEGTVSTGDMQIYYLNSIQTATHTAFFIKDIRSDAHTIADVSGNRNPVLRLSKIVLVKNENIPLFTNSATLSFGSFSSAGCSGTAVQPHIANYNANDLLIKSNSLITVDLIADYSLCRNLYNNINNTFTTTTNSWDTTNVYKSVSSSSTTSYSNSGKLTLNEVKVYAPGYKASGPSYLFDYDQSNSAKNPDYNPDQCDYWGYYKSDYNGIIRSHYTSDASGVNVDAWSLKKITTPLGGEISIEYESDVYDYSCNNDRNFAQPQRYFPISAATNSSYTWQVTVSAGINDFWSSGTLIRKQFVLPFTVGPWDSHGDPNYCPNDVAYGGTPVLTSGDPVLSISPTGLPSATQKFLVSNYAYSVIGAGCDVTVSPTYTKNRPAGYGYLALSFSSVPGGGARVKKITVKDTESSSSYINEYTYERGVIGAEPVDMLVRSDYGLIEKNNNAGDPLIPYSGVSYTIVNVKSKSLNNVYNGRTQYEFYNTYEPTQVNKSPDVITVGIGGGAVVTANYVVTKTMGILNSPNNITVYDNSDNIVRLTHFDYQLSDDRAGQVTEKYNQSLSIVGGALIQGSHSLSYKKARVIKKTDYYNGLTTTEESVAWDPITGEVTDSRITNPTEGITETVTIPAFRFSSYTDMGPKSISTSYKNMTDAPYKVTISKDKLVRDVYGQLLPSGSPSMIGGSKTTWRQSYPLRLYGTSGRYVTQSATSTTMWYPYQSYSFNGTTDDTQWKYEGEATIFNKRNSTLEAKDGNNRYAATKQGYDQRYTLCKASDAHYSDFAFSGFEDLETATTGVIYFGGEVTHGEMRYAGDAVVTPHTGKFLAKVDPGTGPGHYAKGFTVGRSYRASVWVHKNSPSTAALVISLNGTSAGTVFTTTQTVTKTDASNVTVGDWILMTVTIDVPADFTEVGGSLNDLRAYCNNPGSTTAYFDDLEIRPLDAALSGNVIDDITGRTLAVLDNNDFATRYVYDDSGRIREIWVETATDGWKLKQRYSYNYKRSY